MFTIVIILADSTALQIESLVASANPVTMRISEHFVFNADSTGSVPIFFSHSTVVDTVAQSDGPLLRHALYDADYNTLSYIFDRNVNPVTFADTAWFSFSSDSGLTHTTLSNPVQLISADTSDTIRMKLSLEDANELESLAAAELLISIPSGIVQDVNGNSNKDVGYYLLRNITVVKTFGGPLLQHAYFESGINTLWLEFERTVDTTATNTSAKVGFSVDTAAGTMLAIPAPFTVQYASAHADSIVGIVVSDQFADSIETFFTTYTNVTVALAGAIVSDSLGQKSPEIRPAMAMAVSFIEDGPRVLASYYFAEFDSLVIEFDQPLLDSLHMLSTTIALSTDSGTSNVVTGFASEDISTATNDSLITIKVDSVTAHNVESWIGLDSLLQLQVIDSSVYGLSTKRYNYSEPFGSLAPVVYYPVPEPGPALLEAVFNDTTDILKLSFDKIITSIDTALPITFRSSADTQTVVISPGFSYTNDSTALGVLVAVDSSTADLLRNVDEQGITLFCELGQFFADGQNKTQSDSIGQADSVALQVLAYSAIQPQITSVVFDAYYNKVHIYTDMLEVSIDTTTAISFATDTLGSDVVRLVQPVHPVLDSARLRLTITLLETERTAIDALFGKQKTVYAALSEGFLVSSSGGRSVEIGFADTFTVSKNNYQQIDPVSFSLDSGIYSNYQVLTLTSTIPNAQIFYTTDGTVADSSALRYTDTLYITKSISINAIAYADSFLASEVSSREYTIQTQQKVRADSSVTLVAASGDELLVAAGAVDSSLELFVEEVEVSSESADTQSYRMLSKAFEFGPQGTAFLQPVVFTYKYDPADLAAKALEESNLEGFWFDPTQKRWEAQKSSVDTALNTVTLWIDHFSKYGVGEAVGSVAFSIDSDTIIGDTTLILAAEADSALIRYTLDGSIPTDSSTVYTAPIPLHASTIVRAVAYKNGVTPGMVASDTFTVVHMPQVYFAADVVVGERPLAVRFTDTSTGTIQSRSWFINDSLVGTDKTLQYTFVNYGFYDIMLIVSGPLGLDTLDKQRFIHVQDTTPPENNMIFSITSNGDTAIAITWDSTTTGLTDATGFRWHHSFGLKEGVSDFDTLQPLLSGTHRIAPALKQGWHWISWVVEDSSANRSEIVWDSAEIKNTPPRLYPPRDTVISEAFAFKTVLKAQDINNDSLLYSLFPLVDGLQINPTSGQIEWTPHDSSVGVHTLTAKVQDGFGGVDSSVFTITVKDFNFAPQTAITIVDLNYGAARIQAEATDDKDTNFTFVARLQLTAAQQHFDSLVSTTGQFVFAPLLDGQYLIDVYAIDSKDNPDTTPAIKSFSISGVSSHTFDSTQGWNMISIPSDSVDAAYVKAQGYLSIWDESRSEQGIYSFYTPSEQIVQLDAARSYWRKSDSARSIQLAANQLISESKKVVLHNSRLGWNQVANPYVFAVKWPYAATLWSWNGVTKDFESVQDSVLVPWKGYWVLSDAVDTVELAPEPVFVKGVVGKAHVTNFVDQVNWRVRFVLRQGTQYDAENVIGFSKDAKNSADAFDLHEPPRYEAQPYLFFPHNEWDHPAQRYSFDIRQHYNEEIAIFEMGVEPGDDRATPITIVPTGIRDLQEVYLFILDKNGAEQLTDNSEIRLERVEQTMYKTVIATTNPSLVHKIPLSFDLSNPYPNPSRPFSKINYRLPYRWESNGKLKNDSYEVQINIYNSLGRVVRNLVHTKKSAGNYISAWDGKTNSGRMAANGSYFIRLRAAPFKSVKKVVMLR